MGVPIRDFLKARRDRALGSILGHAERNIWRRLEEGERAAFRQVVVDALNGYHDSVLDLMKSDDGVRNEELLRLLQQLHSSLKTTQRS
jgi:hypothetical protein